MPPQDPNRPPSGDAPPSGTVPLRVSADGETTRGSVVPRRVSGGRRSGPDWEAMLAGFSLREGGRYEALDLLGEGGMGLVYKALDRQLQRVVAIKFLKCLEDDDVARFLKEARAQAQLDHPNVCRIFEVGEAEGQPYLVMQFVDGPALSDAAPQLSLQEKVTAVEEAAEALHACHRAGIVHRDVKPGNIMMQKGEDGSWEAFLMDFGVARDLAEAGSTQTRVMMGTPAYFSPEQALGRHRLVDRRTDIYALGATLYECVTGRVPFQSESTLDLLRRIAEEEPEPPAKLVPGLPRDLQTIIQKAMAKEPAQRYDSARAFAEDLRRFREGDPILARPPSWSYRAGKALRKNRFVAAALILVLGALAYAGITALRAQSQARFAQRLAQEVERLNARIFQVRSMPLHDTGPELKAVRARLEQLREETEHEGRWAQGPARLALGRGFLALGDLDQARAELEMARKAAPKDPEVAQALGTALARLYVNEIQGLRGKALEERRQELEAGLRGPALQLLMQGRGQAWEGSAYAEGLLDFVGGRREEALAKAREAQARQPWGWEAWVLEADIHKEAGLERLASNDAAGGEADLEAAGRALDRACQLARSAPEPLAEEAQRRLVLLGLKLDAGRAGLADRDWALVPAQQALIADPDDWQALSFLTAIHRRWATQLLNRGEDPSRDLDQAAAAARRALDLRPSEASLWVNWGTLLRNRAEWELSQGRDPEPFLAPAEMGLQQGLKQPRLHDFLLDGLGNVHALRADRRLMQGQDPATEVREAARCFEAASALRPWVGHDFSEGAAYRTLAQYQVWTGQDPSASLEQALHSHERALALQASSLQSRLGLAGVLLDRAEYALDQGRDAEPDLLAARKELGQAQARQANNADVLAAAARERFLSARAADSMPMAREGLALQQRASAAAPGSQELRLDWGAMALDAARRLRLPLDAAAASALRQTAAARPWDAWAQLLAAELAQRQGRSAEARSLAAKALALNPALQHEKERRGL